VVGAAALFWGIRRPRPETRATEAPAQAQEVTAQDKEEAAIQEETTRRTALEASKYEIGTGGRISDALLRSIREAVEPGVRFEFMVMERFVAAGVWLMEKDIADGLGTHEELGPLYSGAVEEAYRKTVARCGHHEMFYTEDWCKEWVRRVAAARRLELRLKKGQG
jgi:hypothetical protein